MFACAALVCAVACAVIAASGHHVTQRPSLQAIPATIDLGEIFVGQDQEFRAVLSNVAKEQIEITDASAGCVCTDIRLADRQLARHSTTELHGLLKGKSKAGNFRHHVTIRTSDLAPPLVVPIIGTAKSLVRIDPASIVLRPDFISSRSDEAIVTVTNQSDSELVLKDFTLPSGVSLDVCERVVGPKSSVQIKVRVGCERVVAEAITVRIPCDHLHERFVLVPLHIEPHQPIVVQPREFQLGVVTNNELFSRGALTVLLSGPLLADCEIAVSHLPPYLSLERTECVDSTTLRLHFQVQDHWSGFDLNDEATVSLSTKGSGATADVAFVSIPFRGFLVDARSQPN
jgi:hypothetical protein